MIHKAFILGAGLGTRLRPLTDRLPKPLIPVFHRPLVCHALDRCLAAGIDAFAVNTHHLPEAWPRVFPAAPDGTRSYRGAPLSFFHEPDLLETGGGLKNIASWIGAEPLLVHNGDILAAIDLPALLDAHRKSGRLATLALRSHGEAPHIAFDAQAGEVLDIRSLLGRAPGTHQFTGIYCVEPGILDFLPTGEKVSVIPAFLELARRGQLGGVVLDAGLWADIGTLAAYHEIHQRDDLGPHIHQDAQVDPSAVVDGQSVVGPGAVVGAGARLEAAIVWPGARVPAAACLSHEVFTG